MGKVRPGNKKNSALNGEWATHVRKDGKKATAGLRRLEDKKELREELKGDYTCEVCGNIVRPGEEEIHGFCD